YREAALLTGGAGNGLYTVAAIILTTATRRLPWRRLAWGAWAAGVAVTLPTIANNDIGVKVAHAALMILFVPWGVVARKKMACNASSCWGAADFSGSGSCGG